MEDRHVIGNCYSKIPAPDISYSTDMKLTRRKNIALGIFFVTSNIIAAIIGWHQFENPFALGLNMFAAGFAADRLVEVILS